MNQKYFERVNHISKFGSVNAIQSPADTDFYMTQTVTKNLINQQDELNRYYYVLYWYYEIKR